MASRMYRTGLGAGPALVMGALAAVPLTWAIGGMRAGLATAAAGNRVMLAPLRRPLAEAAEHIADRVADVRAELAGEGDVPSAEVDVVAGRRADGPAETPPRVAQAHAAGRRLRLVARDALSPDQGTALASTLARFPGVSRATWRPSSACLVIDSALPAERLAPALERAGLVHLEPQPARPAAAQATALALAWLDGLVRLRSRGTADLDHVIAMGVAAAALLGRDPALAHLAPEELISRLRARRRVARE